MNQNLNPTRKKIQFEIDPELGTLSYEGTKKYFTRFGLAIFAFSVINFAAQYALYFLLTALMTIIGENAFVSSLSNYIISFVPMYCIALPVFLAIVKPLPEINLIKTKMKLPHTLLGFCMCITLMLVGNYVSTMLIMIIEQLKGETLLNPVATMAGENPWWVNLIFMAILAPVLEEILFRKLICRHLLPLGEGWAIVLSAAIFGLSHGNFYQFFYAFLLGAFFAFIYIKTGKLRYTIFYHIAINLIGGVIAPEILKILDLDLLTEIAENPSAIEPLMENPDQLIPFLIGLGAFLLYSFFMYGLATVGIVFFIISLTKKRFEVDGGILTPIKKGRYSALFLNVGVALSIAYFAFLMVTSLI